MTLNRRVLRRVHSPLRSPCRSNTSLRKKALIRQISGEVQFGASSKANLKVVVRVRPFNQRELDNNANCVVDVVDEYMLVFDPRREEDDFFFKGARQRTRDFNKKQHREQKFAFERVFSYDSTNEQLYQSTTHDLLDTLLAGYNCSVFAYGATGAGKTFTMLGTEECPGITFLTLMELYKRIDNVKEEKTIEVAVSYLEVYNEMVRDLLQPGKALSLQEVGQQVMVPGLSLHKPVDAKELMQMLAHGNQNRTQHPTDANSESSRSHAVFQVFVKQYERLASGPKTNVCISKLSMIDLAGSERGAATGFKGARFREGASINKSLLALGNCINALADGQRHIPYRDSKLTRLLKDSLGGNCRSVMIAAISPASTTFEDTFNTLRYANRAKTIKTTLKKNLLNVDQHVSNYVKIVADLREEVVSLNAKLKKYEEKEAEWEKERASLIAAQTPAPASASELTPQERDDLEAKNEDLEAQLGKTDTSKGESDIASETGEAQRSLEEASRESRMLRCELMRLESAEREMQFKIHAVTARLHRMQVISFASQKLDKSIARCQRILRNLAKRLTHIANQKQTVQGKLRPSLDRLAQLRDHPMTALPPHLADKLLANGAVHEYHQHCGYLSGLLEEGFKEQSVSEQLIIQLLHATRQFYVQLRADNQCTPTFTQIFQNVVDSLDESKIAWADQQASNTCESESAGGSHGTYSAGNTTLPPLDATYFSQLPFTSTVHISPLVAQDRPRPRKSSLKTDSLAELPQLPSQCLASANDPRPSPLSFCSPVSEEVEVFRQNEEDSCTTPTSSEPRQPVPSSPVLSAFSFNKESVDSGELGTEKSPRLPVITTHLPVLPVNKSSTLPPLISTSTIPSPQTSDIPQSNDCQTEAGSLGFVSISQKCGLSAVTATETDSMNTEMLDGIEPVDCSMNTTFSVTPGKALNTTIDIPSSSSASRVRPVDVRIVTVSSTLSTLSVPTIKSDTISSYATPAFKRTFYETCPSSGQISVTTSSQNTSSASQSLSKECPQNVPSASDHDVGNESVTDDSNTIRHQNSDQSSKTASRKLFLPSLDSTFCVGNDSGLLEIPATPSPPVISVTGITVTTPASSETDTRAKSADTNESLQRSPLQLLANKSEKFAPHTTDTSSDVLVARAKSKSLKPGSGLTPHKMRIQSSITPTKTSMGRTISSTLGRGGNGAMKRSVSTPSLAIVSSTTKAPKHLPSAKKKFLGLGGGVHRTSSILHSKTSFVNQENVPPGSVRKNGGQSSILRETVSSAAKHAVGIGKP